MSASRKAVSEELVIDTLTQHGRIPLACSFLMGGAIYFWEPEGRLVADLIEDNALDAACRLYLLKRGSYYESLEEVAAIAAREKWPNWERI